MKPNPLALGRLALDKYLSLDGSGRMFAWTHGRKRYAVSVSEGRDGLYFVTVCDSRGSTAGRFVGDATDLTSTPAEDSQ